MTKLFKKAQRALRARKTYLATVAELNSLSDRGLADIGINRSEIEFIARKNAKKKSS